MTGAPAAWEPPHDCPRCPRLVGFRDANRAAAPDWHNAPVPSFRPADAPVLLVVGLAPGLKGANRTGRPFTGDYAGDLLYPTLLRHGFARGRYGARRDDGIELVGCQITNAVRCVPPANKPVGAEVAACRGFLVTELSELRHLRVVLALGAIAHGAVVAALRLRARAHPFAHGAVHALDGARTLVDSYHCSRYNVNTGKLTATMFDAAVATARALCVTDAPTSAAPAGASSPDP